MDHENERWIKVYTRDTGGWLELSWQARGLALEISRKLDADGRLPLGKRGLQSLAGVVRARWEDIKPFVQELILDDRLQVLEDNVLWDPEHKVRQSAVSSPALRKKLQRNRESVSRDVTPSHAASRAVTNVTIRSEEIRSEEIRSDQTPRAVAPVEEPVAEAVGAKHRYRAAYCSGIARGKGAPYAWPSGPSEKYADEALGNAIRTHAVSRSTGKHIRGDDLLGWLGDAAEEFAATVTKATAAGKDDPKYWSSFNPQGLLRFLNQERQQAEVRDVG